MNVIWYEHHGRQVAVFKEQQGKHREHCLCFANCLKFKPGQKDNCPIAQATYDNCVKFGTTTPVFECPQYEQLKAEIYDRIDVREALVRCGFEGQMLEDTLSYMLNSRVVSPEEDIKSLAKLAEKYGEDAANLDVGIGNAIALMNENKFKPGVLET